MTRKHLNILVVSGLCLALAGCGGADSSNSGEPSDAQYMAAARQNVLKLLRDPDAAKFGEMRISRKSGMPVLCGTVNATNGFGGKVGYQQFVAGGVAAIEEQSEPEEWQKIWDQFC